jgi:hypothetical protein
MLVLVAAVVNVNPAGINDVVVVLVGLRQPPADQRKPRAIRTAPLTEISVATITENGPR